MELDETMEGKCSKNEGDQQIMLDNVIPVEF